MRAIVLTGAGRAFCLGLDTEDLDRVLRPVSRSTRTVGALCSCPPSCPGRSCAPFVAGRARGNIDPHYHFTSFSEAVVSAEDAYAQAGVADPRAEIAMAEVHDCLTPTELVLMEDLGFAERNFGWKEVLAGTFDLDGELPVNPDGGLSAFGLPIGASRLRMMFECRLQLRARRPRSAASRASSLAASSQSRTTSAASPGSASASSSSSAPSRQPDGGAHRRGEAGRAGGRHVGPRHVWHRAVQPSQRPVRLLGGDPDLVVGVPQHRVGLGRSAAMHPGCAVAPPPRTTARGWRAHLLELVEAGDAERTRRSDAGTSTARLSTSSQGGSTPALHLL